MRSPILFNFDAKKALVVGAGKVGRRRAKTLAGYGCQVLCIGLDAEHHSPPEGVQLEARAYSETQLAGMDLVVAATGNRELNQRIAGDCRKRHILVNVADAPETSDFIFPSVVRRGDLTLSVCTDGASPFLAQRIKKELEALYGEDYGKRTALLKTLRKQVLEAGLDEKEKRDRLREMSDWSIEKLNQEVNKG